jgi:hypothetical protein
MELKPDAVVILDAVMDDVVMDDIVFKELTFIVEYSTPGAPLLILETVKVDKVKRLEVINDPVRDETAIDAAEMVEPVRVDKDNDPVVMEAVVMVDPWRVLTIMAGARTFRRALKLASPDAISTMILFFGTLNNTK